MAMMTSEKKTTEEKQKKNIKRERILNNRQAKAEIGKNPLNDC